MKAPLHAQIIKILQQEAFAVHDSYAERIADRILAAVADHPGTAEGSAIPDFIKPDCQECRRARAEAELRGAWNCVFCGKRHVREAEHPDTIAIRELREAIDRNFGAAGSWQRLLDGERFYAVPKGQPGFVREAGKQRQTIREAWRARYDKLTVGLGPCPQDGHVYALNALIDVLDERGGQ